MKKFKMKHLFKGLFCIAVILLSACHKKEEQAAQTPAPDAGQPSATVSNQAPGNPAAQAPVIDTSKALAEADAALRRKEYEQAVATMLKLQQQRGLTEQQSEAVRNAQIHLQQNLAGAVAGGDPKAKAAADMLRAASAHR